jgi:hypothetical protein
VVVSAFVSETHHALVRLLDSPDTEIVVVTWRALANLAGDELSTRNKLLDMGLASRCASTIEVDGY